MPRYDAICRQCGKTQEYTRPIAEMYATPVCCGENMEKVTLTPIAGNLDWPTQGRKVWGKPSWRRD